MEIVKLELTRLELDLLFDALNTEKASWEVDIEKWKKEWRKFAEDRVKKITSLLDKLHKLERQFGYSSEHLS